MKTIRTVVALVGLSLVLSALGATRAGAQNLETTVFAGTFTLPVQVQWGSMTLPAGNYSLYYGKLFMGGTYTVEVVGKAKRSLRGWIPLKARTGPSTAKNSLICIRDGNNLVVRRLEMPAIGESLEFAMRRGMKLLTHRQKHGQYTLAEAPILIQRVPVKPIGK